MLTGSDNPYFMRFAGRCSPGDLPLLEDLDLGSWARFDIVTLCVENPAGWCGWRKKGGGQARMLYPSIATAAAAAEPGYASPFGPEE
jgi:hypothetical protein